MNRLHRAFHSSLLAATLLTGASAARAELASGDEFLDTLQSAYTQAVVPSESAQQHRELIATLLQRVRRSAATEVDMPAFSTAALKVLQALPPQAGEAGEVFMRAVNAGLRTLDGYARYIPPQRSGGEREESTGSFVGLGLRLEPASGAADRDTAVGPVRITDAMPATPAARAGLQAGDLITRIDGQTLDGVALTETITRLRGAAGTAVSVTLERPGQAGERTLALTRETISRPLLRWRFEGQAHAAGEASTAGTAGESGTTATTGTAGTPANAGDVLVLTLSSFSGPVSAALERAVAEASAVRAPRAVVLDLRGNGGGLLREGVRVADAFLTHGEITSLRGRTQAAQRRWAADEAELLAGVPVVVLTDKGSASASELVAAALQDHGRAVVMGQRSYGKGSVQTTYPLGDDQGSVKLTTAHYHAPSGRSVQKAGVVPDIELTSAAQERCPRLASVISDRLLSCALSYLNAGSAEAFKRKLAGAQP